MTTAAKPAPPANGTIEALNHFEKSHPKDDLEIKKHRDESIGRTTNKKENGKKGKVFEIYRFQAKNSTIGSKIIVRSPGKAAKKDNSPASNAFAVAEKSNTNAANDAVDTAAALQVEPVVVQQLVAVQAAAPPKESPKNSANKEKSNKKKRNDALLVQQLGKQTVNSYRNAFRFLT